jgi:GNAT superfamily N-acetyltransferase
MPSFLIRDALETDIAACLALDHRYETDQVWQMNIRQEVGQWAITFKTDRLPRTMEVTYPCEERRLRLSLPEGQCFLVAETRFEPDEGHDEENDEPSRTHLLGYLTMRNQPSRRIAWIEDMVVGREYRRQRIGSRLLRVARQWALENGALRLMIETQTKNFPAISFCTATGCTFCGYNDQYFENQDIAVFFAQSLR